MVVQPTEFRSGRIWGKDRGFGIQEHSNHHMHRGGGQTRPGSVPQRRVFIQRSALRHRQFSRWPRVDDDRRHPRLTAASHPRLQPDIGFAGGRLLVVPGRRCDGSTQQRDLLADRHGEELVSAWCRSKRGRPAPNALASRSKVTGVDCGTLLRRLGDLHGGLRFVCRCLPVGNEAGCPKEDAEHTRDDPALYGFAPDRRQPGRHLRGRCLGRSTRRLRLGGRAHRHRGRIVRACSGRTLRCCGRKWWRRGRRRGRPI